MLAVAAVVASRRGQRRALRRVARAERRAADAERLAELGTMTGGLAHEIRNPLSTIGLLLGLLAEDLADADLDDETRRALDRRIDVLRREIDRLGDILEDFLQFAGQMRLDRGEHDLNRIVDELSDFFHPQADRADVRLDFRPASEPLPVHADAPLVKQALLNLLLNATEAMTSPSASGAEEGEPRPRLLRLGVERVHAGEEEDGPEQARVVVADTGPGIEPDRQKRIFEPYFSTKRGGSGLGLPIAKRIAEEHGGGLEVRSEPGKGTEFVLSLPLDAEEPTSDSSGASA